MGDYMIKMNEGKNNGNYWKTLLIVIASLICIVFIGVYAFIRFYDSYIDHVLYKERLNQMREVTTQLFTGIEDVMQNQRDRTDTFCRYVELGKPDNTESLLTFMRKQVKLNGMDEKSEDLVAVDELGRYLTQDGWQGTLEEMDLLLDKPDKTSFVSKSMTSGRTYMYFLNRLEEPVVMKDGGRTVRLIYYGFCQDMEKLNHYFTCDAYNNSNSVYVLDNSGARIFCSSSSNLIPGYNSYSTLEGMEYLHGNSFDEAKNDLDSTGHGYSNAVLDGMEYYYALYRMEHAEWTLLFLVPSSYVASDVVSMVSTTVRLIVIFAGILLVVTTILITLTLHLKQRQEMETEHQNSEKLAQINKELDHKNSRLIQAVQLAKEATKKAEVASERAEQAMVEAQNASRAKTDFLANMSHDIRTPMNAIVGITSLMAHEKTNPEKLDTYIHKVQSSSKHLLSLINDVLDMSKIESGEVTLNMEHVNFAEQVNQIDSIVRPQLEERNQSFIVRVHEIFHEDLIGDSVRMRQVFINLLSNAIKYTPNGGEISLDITELVCDVPGKAKYSIIVKDNGYGMTPEFLQRIFEPFTRAENSTTNKVQGTGLGMAITKNIVELMGGTITVQSGLGKGSRFEVTIMLDIDENVDSKLPVNNIMLVTDEDALVRNVRAALTKSGAVLYTVSTVEEAEKLIEQEKVDVILLGGHLYDSTLSETVKQLKNIAKDAVLIFCCDYASQEKVYDILTNSGIDGLVARPFFLLNFANVLNQKCGKADNIIDSDANALKGKKFLCAEDNALNAEILQAILEMEGATCKIYPNGKEIAEAFVDVRPGDYDAILMDVQMPVMNGLDATRAIRRSKNPLGRTIPIIAMTANAFSSDVKECLDAGMNAHVSKPLDIAVLKKTLSHC